jgi:Cu2+-exporting ATPase
MSECSLCGLPTPDPPVTDETVEGSFCCRGCLHVTRTLGDVDQARERLSDRADERVDRDRADERVLDADRARQEAVEPVDEEGLETAFLSVEGMHCATCELFLESRAGDHDAVSEAAASYPAGLLKVAYDPTAIDTEALPGLVDGLGYRVRGVDGSESSARDEAGAGDNRSDESDAARAAPDVGAGESSGRLLVGGFFGMMVMCWYLLFLYPSYLGFETQLMDVGGIAGRYLLWNVWAMASVVLGYTGMPLLRGAYVSLRTGLPNMDLLVALAAVTAYVYSTLVLLLGGTEVYFDVAIVIVLAVTIGGAYEDRIRRRAAATLTGLTEERASVARRRTDEGVEEVAVDALEPSDEVLVKAGERIPVDGTVREGSAAVDESLLTGESLPVRRDPGDDAIGGALVAEGGLVVDVDPGAESTADRLVELLWNAQTARSGTQRIVDRLAALFVPAVVVLALGAAVWHAFGGAGLTRTLLIGLSVLVVSCPCALGLATPLAISAGVRSALEDGVVVTDGSAFERASDVETVAFDKTGTLTTGSMQLLDHRGDADVLQRAAALEQFADHPIAVAVVDAAADEAAAAADTAAGDAADGDTPVEGETATASDELEVTDVTQYPGSGIGGVVGGAETLVGKRSLFTERGWTVPESYADRYAAARESGTVPALVGWGGAVRGVLVAGDEPRPEWESVVEDLAADRRVVVISGDDRRAAERFRAHPAVDEVFAGVPPAAKAQIVERLQADGPVAMVGDGSNDAPALATADLGISLERGTRLAADAADAVVTTDDLGAVARTFEVLDATRRRIRQNLGWALCYNAVAIPLAVTGLLNPLFAAVAMAVSSLLVVGNSARKLGGSDGKPDGLETSEEDGSGATADGDPESEPAVDAGSRVRDRGAGGTTAHQ